MAEGSLMPGYIVLQHTSSWGEHAMTLPTRVWNSVGAGGDLGSYQAWDTTNVDAEAMIDALVDKLKEFFHTTTTFVAATVYTKASDAAPAIPVAGKALSVAGVLTTTLQRRAVQQTWTFRDSGWNVSRLVLLDAPIGSNFDPTTDITGVTAAEDLVAEWTGDGNAWSSRQNLQPTQFRRIVYDLNDKLRKQYKMT